MKVRFGAARCCCGGVPGCLRCEDSFDALSGVYTTGQTIPGTCGLHVTAGVVTAASGTVSLGSTGKIQTALGGTVGARYIAIHATMSNGTAIKIFPDASNSQVYLKLTADTSGRWVLTAANGANVGQIDLAASFPVSDMLLEVCFFGEHASLSIPFLSRSIMVGGISSIGSNDCRIENAGTGSLVIQSVHVETHADVDPTCAECPYFGYTGQCEGNCYDDTSPATITATLPTFTSTVSPACSGSIPCSGIAGTYVLFKGDAGGGGFPRCKWSVTVPAACWDVAPLGASPIPFNELTVFLDGSAIPGVEYHQWRAEIQCTYPVAGNAWAKQWKGPNNTGFANKLPITCSGRSVTLTPQGYPGSFLSGIGSGCITSGNATITT